MNTYHLLVDLSMVAHNFLSDNLNMNFGALAGMDSPVHFLGLEIRNLDHLGRRNVDSYREFHHICKKKKWKTQREKNP